MEISETEERERSRLLQRLSEFRPDAVQVGPINAPAPLIAAVWDGPLIAASWGFDLLLEVQRSDAVRRASRQVLRRADLIFVDSQAVCDEALRLGADPAGIVRFPWGISREWIKHAPGPRVRLAPFVFLSTRRHEPIYRVQDSVAAFLEFAPEYHDSELWIAGSGSLTGALQEIVERSGFQDRVHFLGEQNLGGLRELYANAHAYLSSSMVDGTSVSLLEAMASGALPVVTDIPGNQEWVRHDAGLLYPVGDVAQLRARMLQSVQLSSTAKEQMATIAFGRVRELADWDTTRSHFAHYMDLAIERHEAA